MNNIKICIIGLGYVGLPLAISLSKKYQVTGYDININRIKNLIKGKDDTFEVSKKVILKSKINFTNNKNQIKDCNFYIITVPTPVLKNNMPDLGPLINGSKLVGKFLNSKDVVVYESTTYPGCTNEICIPLLEKFSNLKVNDDFYCGYSPERINPGDKKHGLSKIKKIISASSVKGLKYIKKVYDNVSPGNIIEVNSIQIAEGAKIIENTQRDINIALMNELSILFNKLNIDFTKVLSAAKTKWNFINFKPGLVGGHCIGVDPYYLAFKAKKVKFNPKIILSGRSINDYMHKYVVKMFHSKFSKGNINYKKKILIVGLTFKENVPDCRNSQSIKIAKIISKKSNVFVFDPITDHKIDNCKTIKNYSSLKNYKGYFDGILVLVSHTSIKNKGFIYFKRLLKKKGIFFDLKNTFKQESDFKL